MLHEDADVAKIRSFVTKCLESAGAIVEFPEYDYAEVLVPDDLAWHFDGETYFNLSFDFDVARQHEDSELVTYGSYFLDKVLELASLRGLTCKRHIMDEDVEGRTLPQKIRSRISFRNCRANFLANAPVIYHYVLFNFRVSYISDERLDRIVRELVDLNSGRADDRMLEAVGSVIFTDSPHTNYSVEHTQSVEDAYQAATRDLEERIQPTMSEIDGRIMARLAGEKKRIAEYYDEIDNELKLKREKLVGSDNEAGIKSIDDKLRLSEIERQRRLNEIEEKNALKVSVMLFNATLISHTKVRNRYKLKRGRTERDVYVVWNPVLNDIDPLVCEICGKSVTEVELCSNSHVGCTDCVHACSVCDARLCKDCGMAECVVCGAPLCDQHKKVCEECGSVVCEKHIEYCICKEQKRREAAEQEERKKKEKLEEEQRIRQEKLLEFQDIPLQLSRSIKQYMDGYVRRNIDVLDEKWREELIKAEVAILQGNSARARSILQKLDQEYPDNVWVKANLVLSYKGWSQKVASLANEAVKMAPNMALAHFALAHEKQIHGSIWVQQTVEIYEKVIELAKGDEGRLVANAYYQIGNLMQEHGYPREAANAWRRALRADRYFWPAHQALTELETSGKNRGSGRR